MPIIQFDVGHAIAGGAAGCAGAVVTSPLEIVKTRLQSSVATFHQPLSCSTTASSANSVGGAKHTAVVSSPRVGHYTALSQWYRNRWSVSLSHSAYGAHPGGQMCVTAGSATTAATAAAQSHAASAVGRPYHGCVGSTRTNVTTATAASTTRGGGLTSHCSPLHHLTNSHHTASATTNAATHRVGLVHCFRYIVEREGVLALYKGLLPTLVGVVPSRSIFFCAYESLKNFLHNTDIFIPDTVIHMSCSGVAGFAACTLTNPVWVMKTRLQLDQSCVQRLTIRACFRQVMSEHGVPGFYKGITASYAGISETVIHIAIYERMKRLLYGWSGTCECDSRPGPTGMLDQIGVPALAAFTSKSCASFVTYPTEVARTRLRQSGSKYRGFFQTVGLIFREEGFLALFRGVGIQIIQKVPNTMVTMITYELVSQYLIDDE